MTTKEKQMTTEQRVTELETRCKRLTLALSSIMALAIATICVAAKPGPIKDALQVRKLEIVDNDGKVRIRIGPIDCGYGLNILDVDGSAQATLADAPLVESKVCQYSSTADGDFIVDQHPRASHVWIVGGGSGIRRKPSASPDQTARPRPRRSASLRALCDQTPVRT